MAKRYRYAFAKKKEAKKGKLSAGLAVASFLLFLAAVLTASYLNGKMGFIPGGISLFAAMLSVYGFIMGMISFSEPDKKHGAGFIGSILNGVIMVGWIGLFLAGM